MVENNHRINKSWKDFGSRYLLKIVSVSLLSLLCNNCAFTSLNMFPSNCYAIQAATGQHGVNGAFVRSTVDMVKAHDTGKLHRKSFTR